MTQEESEPKKKAKKAALPDVPAEPKEEVTLPSPREIRTAKKAQLVEWAEAAGLSTEGKVDELRTRLLERVGKGAPAAPEKPEREAEAEAIEGAEAEASAEAPEYEAKAKPKLDPRMRHLLALRAATDARRPKFRRQEWFRYRRLGEAWRRPQGGQSKLRRHFGYRWNIPSVGYRGPRGARGLHPSGFREVLVHNVRQLEGLDPETEAVRIAHGVGTRKRELIEKACDDKGLRVLNRMVTE